MRTPLLMAVVAALLLPAGALASGEFEPTAVEGAAVPQAAPARFVLPALGISDWQPAAVPAATLVDVQRGVVRSATFDAAAAAAVLARLETAARDGDLNAAVELARRHEQGEGVAKDPLKAYTLYCRAARYGHAEALFNLGRAYAAGGGVERDEPLAMAMFKRAADRGHTQASRLLAGVAENRYARQPPCLAPAPLPLAVLPRMLAGAPGQEPQVPAAPKEIMQLVHKLAPQYAIDSDLALAVMWAESSFDPNAVSAAKAQGLMQLIPETAERFGVRNAFRIDENIKGGLAYLRWLLAYFRGDVSLALAGYNAGEGAVDKHGGIPPFAETREYVQKIISVYRRLVHPYNPGVVGPSPLVSQARRTM